MRDLRDRLNQLTPEQRAQLLQQLRAVKHANGPNADALGVNGAKPPPPPTPAEADGRVLRRPVELSLFFFSGDGGTQSSDNKYDVLMSCAKWADQRGFRAVWIPERHFHPFGGLYPNPAVLASALAVTTRDIHIRAGSVVLPLHHPLRIVEEWSVVDNLSRGRIGLAFASGWHADDFVLSPAAYAPRRELLTQGLREIVRIWEGGEYSGVNGLGDPLSVRPFPAPWNRSLPVWMTCLANDSFAAAGDSSANVLTGFLYQNLSELRRKIETYRTVEPRPGAPLEKSH